MEERKVYDDKYVNYFRDIESFTIEQWKKYTSEWNDELREFVKNARTNGREARIDEAWSYYRASITEKDKTQNLWWKSLMLNLTDEELDRIIDSFS